ncbi:MAG TPA: metallophosphoesterase [Verrucomicrobiae bacterium]|nr:metallophosphoesterase [Verrucomicrobiae bacterium]
MALRFEIAIVSDIHYAGAAEQARGNDYELRCIPNPLLRIAVRGYRRFIWMYHPLGQGHLLDQFMTRVGSPDLVVANGDYSCNSAFVGVSDEAACRSARECLDKLRGRFAPNFRAIFGDHELGKISFFGMQGGMRLASWKRAIEDVGLEPLWRADLGRYTLIGVTSSLIALPVFEADALREELPEWHRLRDQHMAGIREIFASLPQDRRVLLFSHDPTALPFLWREETVRAKLPQIENTIIGHLHSNLVFWKSRLLAGIPPIRFLGHTAKRLTTALRDARHWRPFHVMLCPAIAGIELLKDGGFLTVRLEAEAREPVRIQFHRLKR